MDEDLWEVIKSILSYFDKIEVIYFRERSKLLTKEGILFPDKMFKTESLPDDKHYNYAIHSHSSVWTVRKR